MGISEIVIILVIALILFGPEDLPVIARKIGKVYFEIRKVTNELTKEFQSTIDSPVNTFNYDGENTKNVEIEELVRKGKAIAICPEMIAGLNIPRDSCEIIVTDDGEKRVISKEKKDLTEAFRDGAQKTLE